MLQKIPKINPVRVRAELCRRSFFFFVQEFWETIISEDPVWNWHIRYLCDELQLISERIKRREEKLYDLIINIPPGTSKSTVVSQMLPAWAWTIDPTIRVINSTHSKTLSIDMAEKCRTIIQSDKYQEYFPEIEIMQSTEAKSHFKNTKNGERYATSVGESKIGIHAHLIIVDDPINPKKASSESERLTANKHITQTLSTRKVDKKVTVTVVIMQRLHQDDPTGHLLAKKKERIKHICLPAELSDMVKPEELKDRYVNGLMDPVRMDADVLKEAKGDLGSYGFAGQFKQQPADEEGGIIKRKWFRRYNMMDMLQRAVKSNTEVAYQYFVDGAYTEDSEKNDPTAIMCACKIGNEAYIIDVVRVWKDFPDLIAFIKKYVQEQGYESTSRIRVEPKASGKSIVAQLRRETGLNVVEDEPPTDSKETRAHSISPIIESGRVLIPEDAPWVDAFLDEITTFPKSAHDDQVDVLTSMCKRFFLKTGQGGMSWTSNG